MQVVHPAKARRGFFQRVTPFGPIVRLELRAMARRKRAYVLRFVYLGLLLLVLLIGAADSFNDYGNNNLVMQAQKQAETGKMFYGIFAFFSVIGMMLIGPILTCTAIGGERLRKTFHVLLMTPISSWQIVSGKMFARMLTAFVLIGLSLPVLSIVRLLGGVELNDMLGVIGLSLATGFFSASIGLLFSCWMTRAWAVILLSYITQGILYLLIPMFLMIFGRLLLGNSSSSQLYSAMQWILIWPNPGASLILNIVGGSKVGTSWVIPIIIQIVMASVLLFWSQLLVRRIAKKEGGGETPVATSATQPLGLLPPPLPGVSSENLELQSIKTPTHSRTVSDLPMLWYELRRPMFRKRGVRLTASMIVVGLLLLSYFAFATLSNSFYNPLAKNDLQIGYAIVFFSLIMLMSSILSATAIASEKESDTWTLLIASPISGQQVVWGKFGGILHRLKWPMILIAGHFSLFTITMVIPFWCFLMILWVMMSFNVLFVATGLWLSLRIKNVTTAVVLNLLVPTMLFAGLPVIIGIVESIIREWEMARFCYLLHPIFWMGEVVDGCNQGSINALGDKIDTGLPILGFAIAVGLIYSGLGWLILSRMTSNFDRLVGRARQMA